MSFAPFTQPFMDEFRGLFFEEKKKMFTQITNPYGVCIQTITKSDQIKVICFIKDVQLSV
jgi:hypothetical protein